MATTIKLGEEVTVGTTPVEYYIDESLILLNQPFQPLTLTTPVNSGTIQYAIGVTPPAAQKAIASSQSLVIHGVQNGFRNLWVVGSGAGQKFTVS